MVSKFQEPSVLNERRAMVQSKSVSELSQISGLSDLPIPTKVEKFLTNARKKSQEGLRKKLSKSETKTTQETQPVDYYQFSPMAIHDNIYSTLPKSMKIEVMVKSKVQLPSDVTQGTIQILRNHSKWVGGTLSF